MKPPESEKKEITPQTLLEMSFSFTASRILAAGVQLKVFGHLSRGEQTAAEVGRAEGASERGMRMLLNALAGFGLLEKSGDRYRLTPAAARYLVPESPEYVGAMMEEDSIWQSWTDLVKTIREGQPAVQVDTQKEGEKFFSRLIRSLHILNQEPARALAKVLKAGTVHKGLRVLDIACGSGIWGIAVAEADPQARLTCQDFPGVLEHTRQYLQRHGVLERCAFLPGDLKVEDFGQDRFDLAILGNIVHSEGEQSTRDLFRRLYTALKPGRRVAVIEMIPHDDRSGPPFPLVFALNMLAHTRHGDTYTLTEFRRWFADAGFPRMETADIGSHSPLVMGIK